MEFPILEAAQQQNPEQNGLLIPLPFNKEQVYEGILDCALRDGAVSQQTLCANDAVAAMDISARADDERDHRRDIR
jgi:hypothetical protein